MPGVAVRFFSPPGRRWPEGSDEGEASPHISTVAPSSRCRGLLPGGEKKQAVIAVIMRDTEGMRHCLRRILIQRDSSVIAVMESSRVRVTPPNSSSHQREWP